MIDYTDCIICHDLLKEKTIAFKLKPIDNLISVLKKEPRKKLYPNTKRNQLCPCGSGKKFKKCCIDRVID